MKILGFTDENTTCDCCGRTELKGTYIMDDNEGNIYNYGSTCGVNAAGLKDSKELKKAVKVIEFDENFKGLEFDHVKVKQMKAAISKGFYTRDQFFTKFGELDHKTQFGAYYNIAHLSHEVILN